MYFFLYSDFYHVLFSLLQKIHSRMQVTFLTGTILKSPLNIYIFMCVHVLSLHSYRKFVRSYKLQIFRGRGGLQTVLRLSENWKEVYFPRNLTSRRLWNLCSQYLVITSLIFVSTWLPLEISSTLLSSVYPFTFLFIYSSFICKEFWWARNRQKRYKSWKHCLHVIFTTYPYLFWFCHFLSPIYCLLESMYHVMMISGYFYAYL